MKVAVMSSRELGRIELGELPAGCDVCWSLDEDDLDSALQGAEALFLWDAGRVGELRRHWSSASSLRWVHAAVTGVDQLCFDELAASSVILTNAGGIYDEAIAEYAVMACLMHERRALRLMRQQQRRQWSWLQGSRLAGKNALIVGPGRIGRCCAHKLAALGAHVGALGSRERDADADFEFIGASAEAERYLPWADHVLLTCPLTDKTHHLVDAAFLGSVKAGAHLLNVGRGGLVDTAALTAALASGCLAGVTLDVVEEEPLDEGSPLWSMEGVLVTPHIAGDADGFEPALVAQFNENLWRFAAGRELACVVDKAAGY
ncbi:MAG: D-2-hydroxyacid dehydrogenase [Coriobacteriales bacterium]